MGSPSHRAVVGRRFLLPVLLTLILAGTARAQASVEIAGFPHVMRTHLANVFGTTVARGVDIVLTSDTVSLAIPIRNNSDAVASGVQLVLAGNTFIQFQPPTIPIGTLPPHATTIVTTTAITNAAPVGSMPVNAVLQTIGGPMPDTLWLSIWSADVHVDDLPGGRYSALVTNAYGTHHARLRAPEVFAGSTPTYFNVQAWHDSIVFSSPFPGRHWGELALETSIQPVVASVHPLDDNEHCYRIKTKSGVPVAGATVTQTVGSWSATGTTNASGEVCFTGVPVGAGHDSISPPAVLAKIYKASGKDIVKVQPPPGYRTVSEGFWPDVPVAANPTPSAPPTNAQGAGSNNTKKCVIVGSCTAICTGIGDVLAFISIPGAGWGIGIASAVAVGTSTTAATVSADPDFSDVAYVGEENTPPASESEVTLREIVDVQVQMFPPPPLRTEFQLLNQYSFTRETDAGTYVHDGSSNVQLPCKVNFSTERVSVTPLRIGVRPTDEGGQPLRGGEVLVQMWFATPTLQTCQAQLLLQDDGRLPDDVAGDGLFTAQVPAGLTPGNSRIFVGVTRVGFDAAENPAAIRYQEVPAALLDADLLVHASGLELEAPRPNPSRRAGAGVAFTLPVEARVSLSVIDAAGRERAVPIAGRLLGAGRHIEALRTNGLEPGVYFVRLRAWVDGAEKEGAQLTRRWVVMK